MQSPLARCGVLILAVLATATAAFGQDVRLKYIARYDRQNGNDHLMGVEVIGEHHVLVCGSKGLTLVDLETLPEQGTDEFVDRMPEYPNGDMLDVFTTVTGPDGIVYLNLRPLRDELGPEGIALVQVDVDAGTLTWLDEQFSEPGVYYEKMSIADDRLYVAAHAYGIRIFDLADPAHPVLVGTLAEGFDDAFAIAVDGTTAYVADGAGGLKVVDVEDPAAPVILDGDDPESVTGASEDVLVIDGHVYVAAGSAGVAVYTRGDIASRQLYDTPVVAKHLAHVGDHLAVADIGGFQVFRIETDGTLTPAASERAQRRRFDADHLRLRLWHGVAGWGDDRVVTAEWDAVEVYDLVDPTTDDQPDITPSTQRIRFAPSGGSVTVQLVNQGSGPLTISDILSDGAPSFAVSGSPGVIAPDETVDVTIEYLGGAPGSAEVQILSDDPNESVLPILIFGETEYLDPGEPAVPFTLEQWTFNHVTDEYEFSVFDLDASVGKIAYFQVFVTW